MGLVFLWKWVSERPDLSPPREDTVRWGPSASHEVGLIRSQIWEQFPARGEINVCCLSHQSVLFCYGSSSTLRQPWRHAYPHLPTLCPIQLAPLSTIQQQLVMWLDSCLPFLPPPAPASPPISVSASEFTKRVHIHDFTWSSKPACEEAEQSLLSSFYRWINWGLARSSDLPWPHSKD